MNLSEHQEKAKRCILGDGNYFLTGTPGTGKTTVLKELIDHHSDIKWVITGSTSTAADLFMGSTLHSAMGIGLGNMDFNQTRKILETKPYKIDKLRKITVLLVDEITMISYKYFYILSDILKHYRKCQKPFGGVKLIFSGDFSQLGNSDKEPFFFQTELWRECEFKIVELVENRRFEDQAFFEILQRYRYGENTEDDKKMLATRKFSKISFNHDDVFIYPLVSEVEEHNEKYATTFFLQMWMFAAKGWSEEFKNVRQIFRIAKSMKVILTGTQYFRSHHLPNGSIGRVEDLNFDFILVRFDQGPLIKVERAKYVNFNQTCYQFPLVAGEAATIHRFQGRTVVNKNLRVKLDNGFDARLAYVAASRLRKLENFYYSGEACFDLPPEVTCFNRDCRTLSSIDK